MVHVVADKADFDNQKKEAGNKLIVIDFFATWCGPCKAIAPVIEALSQQYAGEVVFLKVDVDENEELAQDFNISCMPTFIFLKDDKKLDELSGSDEDELKVKVNKYK